jgi:hypothetical protein
MRALTGKRVKIQMKVALGMLSDIGQTMSKDLAGRSSRREDRYIQGYRMDGCHNREFLDEADVEILVHCDD